MEDLGYAKGEDQDVIIIDRPIVREKTRLNRGLGDA
jgi:hypothetical protein